MNKNEFKTKFINKLIDKNIFYSYKINKPDDLSDNLVIEYCLLYSDVDDIITLFQIFPKRKIKEIWKKQIVPDKRYWKLNIYLAKFFFNIKYVNSFLKSNAFNNFRYEKLRRLN